MKRKNKLALCGGRRPRIYFLFFDKKITNPLQYKKTLDIIRRGDYNYSEELCSVLVFDTEVI